MECANANSSMTETVVVVWKTALVMIAFKSISICFFSPEKARNEEKTESAYSKNADLTDLTKYTYVKYGHVFHMHSKCSRTLTNDKNEEKAKQTFTEFSQHVAKFQRQTIRLNWKNAFSIPNVCYIELTWENVFYTATPVDVKSSLN